jgi:hypothetical protein
MGVDHQTENLKITKKAPAINNPPTISIVTESDPTNTDINQYRSNQTSKSSAVYMTPLEAATLSCHQAS